MSANLEKSKNVKLADLTPVSKKLRAPSDNPHTGKPQINISIENGKSSRASLDQI